MPVLGTGLWEGEDLAPQIAISVNHQDIDANIKELITEIEYDSSDNIANMMKLRVSNPEFMVTDQKVFQVGKHHQALDGVHGTDVYRSCHHREGTPIVSKGRRYANH